VTSTARALWYVAPGRCEIRDEPLPPPGDGAVLVRAEFSGISRGTESLVCAGKIPASEYQRMRAPFQAGLFPFPVKYGYASTGIVERGPHALKGRRVFSLHPHQTRYVVPEAAVVLVPDAVPAARAVLAANMETALNGIWDAEPSAGERVVVVGGGVVGCLAAYVARVSGGCDVTLVDINPARQPVAHALGVTFEHPDRVRGDADLVIHTSGTGAGLATALRAAGFERTILEMSWYGATPVSVPLGEDFHSRRLTLKSSQVGHVATPRRREWTHRRRLELAIDMLSDPALDVLLSGDTGFDSLADAMPRILDGKDVLCHVVRYGE